MPKLSFAEAMFCMGLTAALFVSAGPAAQLLDPGFYRATATKVSDCSLAYQVLGHHTLAPTFGIKVPALHVRTPGERATAKVKSIGREVWTQMGRNLRPLDATAPR